MIGRFFGVCAAVTMAASGLAQAAQQNAAGKEVIKVSVNETQVDVISNVVFSQVPMGRRNSRPLYMTILTPRNDDIKPAVLYFPGGGFTSADREKYLEMRLALAKAGFVVASAEYRTVPDVYPAPVVDAKAAVRYLRANAEKYHINPQKIGVFGDSAGGYVTQMVAFTGEEKQYDRGEHTDVSSEVQAAVTIYGISDLTNIGAGYPQEVQKVHESPAVTEALLVHGPAFGTNPGSSITADPDKAREASPLGHIKQGLPPMLVMHGSNDKLVSPVQSEQLYEALVQAGVSVDYVVVEGAGHGDAYWFQKPIIERVVTWFDRHLK